MAKSSGIQNPCDCGFDPDGMEYCLEGLVISDMFRKEIIVDCNCICHGSVIAFRPKVPLIVRNNIAEQELVAA